MTDRAQTAAARTSNAKVAGAVQGKVPAPATIVQGARRKSSSRRMKSGGRILRRDSSRSVAGTRPARHTICYGTRVGVSRHGARTGTESSASRDRPQARTCANDRRGPVSTHCFSPLRASAVTPNRECASAAGKIRVTWRVVPEKTGRYNHSLCRNDKNLLDLGSHFGQAIKAKPFQNETRNGEKSKI